MTVSDAETSGGGGAQGGVIAEQNRKISPSAPNGASPFSDPTHVHSPCIEASRVNSTLGDVNLSLDEQASLRLFLSHVNSWRGARGYPSLSETAATKFLMARKFQVFKIIERITYLNFIHAFKPLKILMTKCGIFSGGQGIIIISATRDDESKRRIGI